MALRSAIPKQWKNKLSKEICPQNLKDHHYKRCIHYNKLHSKNIILTNSKQIYLRLITDKIFPASANNKWVEIYPFMEQCEWKQIFLHQYKITTEPFLQSFQYKVLNRIINCNDKLHTWKIKDNKICEYCIEIYPIEHFSGVNAQNNSESK